MRRQVKASSVGSTGGSGRIRHVLAALAGTGSLALMLALFVAPAASAAPWGFEQVTPVQKGAGTVSYVDTFRTAPDGESFLYSTGAPFSSIPSEGSPAYTRYLGTRGPDQWKNVSLDPPFAPTKGAISQFGHHGCGRLLEQSPLRRSRVVGCDDPRRH